MTAPQVSTIIPAHNAANYLRQAIDSSLAQTVREHEVIVVDDGSTDSTADVLATYGAVVQVIRQPNRGAAAARNAGARVARGEWLAFLDADDEWLPHKLEWQLDAARRSAAALVYTDRENFGDCQHVSRLQSEGVELHEGDIFQALLMGNFITASSVLVDRRAFEDLGGFEETNRSVLPAEDWDLWLRIAASGRVAVCREPLTRYRWHPGGISRDPDRIRRALFTVLQRAFELPAAVQLSRQRKNRVMAAAWSVVGWEAAHARPRRGAPYFARALAYTPYDAAIWKRLLKSCLGVG